MEATISTCGTEYKCDLNMQYRYLDDFRRGFWVFAIFSYGITVLGTSQCPPP